MPDASLIYWDANLFIHYWNANPDKIQILEAILEEMLNSKDDKVVTSAISKVEVAWAASERLNRALSEEEEAKIDNLWNDSSVLEIVEFNDEISHIARGILRQAMVRSWKPKPRDAIHLASAEWVDAIEMHTYDKELFKYSELIGLEVKEPTTLQPKLF
jgi:predicted nucleic acid-binding protein